MSGLRRQVTKGIERHVAARVRRARNARRHYRPLFIAGAAGSGTSLVALSITQRFECAGVIDEWHRQVSPSSFLALPRIKTFESLTDYADALTPRTSWSVEQGRDDLQETFRSYSDRPGELVVVKGPNVNLTRAGFLTRCCPDAVFALVYRDPAANVEGYKRKWRPFRESSLAETMAFYAQIHEAFLEAADTFPDRVVAIEYERLVAEPDEMLDLVGARLGLVASSGTRRLKSRGNRPGRGLRNVKDGVIEVVTDASARALARLSAAELAEIRATLGPLHERLRGLPYSV